MCQRRFSEEVQSVFDRGTYSAKGMERAITEHGRFFGNPCSRCRKAVCPAFVYD